MSKRRPRSVPPHERADHAAAPPGRGEGGVLLRPAWLPALVIPLLAAAAYSQGVRNRYVHWDDAFFIVENPALRDAAGLRTIWTPGADPVRKFYPLTFTLHWLEYRLWGERPIGYFIVGLALHAFNSLLVFRLARALGDSVPAPANALGPLTAWTAGCLFAAHPMHVATVAWLASRKNVLATTFALLALLAHVRWRRGEDRAAGPAPAGDGTAALRRSGASRDGARQSGALHYGGGWVALACVVAALLSKTGMLTVPISILLLDWLVLGQRGWRPLRAVAPMFVVAALLAAVTAHEEWYIEAKTCAEPLWLRPLAAAQALWFYAGSLLLPLDLKVLYPKWQVAASPFWIAPLAAALAAAVGVVVARRKLGGVAVWCLAHFAVSLGPILGLLPFGYLCYAPVSDHFAYLASVGLLILVGLVLERLSRSMAWSAVPMATIATLLLAVATWQRVGLYRGPVEFWGEALRGNPADPFCRKQYAQALSTVGRFRESLPLWESLVAQDPNNAYYLTSQGVALHALERGTEAMEALRAAVRADPNFAAAHYNLACLLGEQRQLAAARPHAEQAARLAPEDWKHHIVLGEIHADLGEHEQALASAWRAAQAAPASAQAQLGFARLAQRLGRPAEALAALETALRLARQSGDAALLREIEAAIARLRRAGPSGNG